METDNSSSVASSEDGVVLADRNVFVAEKIIRKRRSKTGVYEYFIKWQGWPHKYNTWEPEYNILDDSLVDSFAKRMKKVTKTKHKRTRVSGRTARWQTKQRESDAEKLADSAADSQYVKNVSICLVECPDTCAGNIFDNVLWSLNSCPRSSNRRYRSKGVREDSTEVEIDRVKVKIVEIPVEKCELQVATDHINTDSTAASNWTGFNSTLNCSCPLSPLVRNGPAFGDMNAGESSTRHSDGSLFEMLDLQYLRAPFCDARQIINSTTAMSLKVTSVMSVANTIYADA